jgi:hypothetical protein
MRSAASHNRSVLAAFQQAARWQDDLAACVEQLCATSKLRDLMRRLACMEDTLKRCLKSATAACSSSASLDSSRYSRVLQQLLTAYSHAMRLVNKQSQEQAASDALLLTAETVKDIGLAAADIISTAYKAHPELQQLVVSCAGESGVSFYTTASCCWFLTAGHLSRQ